MNIHSFGNTLFRLHELTLSTGGSDALMLKACEKEKEVTVTTGDKEQVLTGK